MSYQPPPQGYSQYPQQPMQGQPPYPQQPPQGPYAPPPRKSRKGLWIALAVGLIVVIGLCSIIGMAGSGAPQTATTNASSTTSAPSTSVPTIDTKPLAWKTTHTFTGNGAKKTAVFTAPDDWKISYTCQGFGDGVDGALAVTVYGSDNSYIDGAINATCKTGKTTKDTTEEHQGGQVYLDINGTGDWTIQVQEQK